MRFLIVDDDESIILFLRTFLSAYAECLTAGDGLEALSAFEAALEEEKPFTAVFMDILMPGMDGNEVVQALRRMEDAANPRERFKLIMISVLTDTKNVSESFFHGRADAYLPKPLRREVLLSELAKLGLIDAPVLPH
ncbi:response regulator [Solidesulfovibrio sp.]|jgi:two-component system chemotaxis response regulator CheY|uniref:response regulator n=1 Tax=Solidesulfovibrio sp. TaxID=2910990 RepID=UPI002B216929|nr:response regulator [Solidesulfovibrio sp.]MEA5090322.1 response regulator [Solidesulfovibrio sp.]HML62976.1 response regulator [Solidesulfovibrio sp.]